MHYEDYMPADFYESKGQADERGFISFFEEASGLYYFAFVDADGRVLLKSEGYQSLAARDNGINSVIKNHKIKERYQLKTNDKGEFFYSLKAANYKEIARTELFPSEADLIVQLPYLIGEKDRKGAKALKTPLVEAPVVLEGSDDYLPADRYTGHPESPAPGFRVFKDDKSGLNYFALVDEDGNLLLRSEGYPTTAARSNGIQSVIKNRGNKDRYSIIENNADNKQYVILKAANHKEIARSAGFEDHAAAYAFMTSYTLTGIEPEVVAEKPAEPVQETGPVLEIAAPVSQETVETAPVVEEAPQPSGIKLEVSAPETVSEKIDFVPYIPPGAEEEDDSFLDLPLALPEVDIPQSIVLAHRHVEDEYENVAPLEEVAVTTETPMVEKADEPVVLETPAVVLPEAPEQLHIREEAHEENTGFYSMGISGDLPVEKVKVEAPPLQDIINTQPVTPPPAPGSALRWWWILLVILLIVLGILLWRSFTSKALDDKAPATTGKVDSLPKSDAPSATTSDKQEDQPAKEDYNPANETTSAATDKSEPAESGPTTIASDQSKRFLYFGFKRSEITSVAAADLDKIVKDLKADNSATVKLTGYTNAYDKIPLNKQVCQERVNNTKKYLVKHGIAASKIQTGVIEGVNPTLGKKKSDGTKINGHVQVQVVK